MRTITCTCDRCGLEVTENYDETSVIGRVEGFLDKTSHLLPGWWEGEIIDRYSFDVCPDCITDSERADQLFAEVRHTVRTDPA